ncbi:MAG: hypothetical protein QM820_64525 [Minicystis sp.]
MPSRSIHREMKSRSLSRYWQTCAWLGYEPSSLKEHRDTPPACSTAWTISGIDCSVKIRLCIVCVSSHRRGTSVAWKTERSPKA